MAAVGLKLYSYWRSSACYRVRIALNLKGLPYEQASVHLANSEQHAEEFGAVNPQQLVPVLIDGERVIRQSQTIIEYLDESYDGEMKLLPATARARARVRALAQMIACDIHPLNNLRVMQYLESEFNAQTRARILDQALDRRGIQGDRGAAGRQSRDRRLLRGRRTVARR